MVNKADFAQEAIARYGEKISDTVVIETKKGGGTKETTKGVNLNGKPNQTIVVS